MAGVFGLIKRSTRQVVIGHQAPTINPKILQLQVAKEILAEVFGIRTSEVDDMIRQRYGERSWAVYQGSSPDEGIWPQEFCLTE